MAVRTSESKEDTPVANSAPGIFAQVVLFASVLGLGFLGNSYLSTLHDNEQIRVEYRGYKDGVRDVR